VRRFVMPTIKDSEVIHTMRVAIQHISNAGASDLQIIAALDVTKEEFIGLYYRGVELLGGDK